MKLLSIYAHEQSERVSSSGKVDPLAETYQAACKGVYGLTLYSAILLWPLVGEIASYMRQSGLVQFPDPEKPSQKSSFEHRFGGPLWAVLQKDADMKRMYDDYMSVRKYGLDQLWYNVFPAAARLKKESTSTSSKVPTIVDVGGGQGQDLVRFLNAHRDGFGSSRYVLEDLPETTRHLGHLPKNIQVVTHNFFNEQPVRGTFLWHVPTLPHYETHFK